MYRLVLTATRACGRAARERGTSGGHIKWPQGLSVGRARGGGGGVRQITGGLRRNVNLSFPRAGGLSSARYDVQVRV